MNINTLSFDDNQEIEELFVSVFTQSPWNDDWSDREQLHKYIMDITGNDNSLSIGLFEESKLIGISLGSIIHWFSGTEYYIREFCIAPSLQKKGYGTIFIQNIEQLIQSKSITSIILSTEKDTSAYYFYRKNGFSVLDKNVFLYKKINNKLK